MSRIHTKSESKRPLGFYLTGIGLLVLAAAVLLVLNHRKQSTFESALTERSHALEAGPHVRVASIAYSESESSVTLEGDATPYASTTLYAKIGGYLHTIRIDKGDEVRQGEVLATIESPETDEQYSADLADATNKAKIAKRDQELLSKQLVAPQTAEQAEADAEVARQTLAVVATNKSYETIKAPFSGRVTGRFVDPGALIQNAVNQETTTQPLVSIAQVDRLRIDVYVDQRYAAFIHVGDPVTITVPERPGFSIKATVTRFTGELDPKTRMQLVEIEIPNKDRMIVPWSTVNVTMNVSLPAHMEVPEEALIVKKDHYFVPVVSAGDRVTFQEVHIGANDGKTVQILDGLTGNEKIGLNVGSSVMEGTHVQPEDSARVS